MEHTMHLYSCEDCVLVFAVEAHEEINQSDAVCPICKSENIEDAGYGTFTVTIPADRGCDERIKHAEEHGRWIDVWEAKNVE